MPPYRRIGWHWRRRSDRPPCLARGDRFSALCPDFSRVDVRMSPDSASRAWRRGAASILPAGRPRLVRGGTASAGCAHRSGRSREGQTRRSAPEVRSGQGPGFGRGYPGPGGAVPKTGGPSSEPPGRHPGPGRLETVLLPGPRSAGPATHRTIGPWPCPFRQGAGLMGGQPRAEQLMAPAARGDGRLRSRRRPGRTPCPGRRGALPASASAWIRWAGAPRASGPCRAGHAPPPAARPDWSRWR